MEKEIRQSITNYKMPRYISEILCNNYATAFLRMSIICEKDTYIFSYDKRNMKRLIFRELSDMDKLQLIVTLIMINEQNCQMLIGEERYLLEPEVMYSSKNRKRSRQLQVH